jgi:hypothetical protein
MCNNGYFHGKEKKFCCLMKTDRDEDGNVCPYDASHPMQIMNKRKQDCPNFGKD